LRPLWYGGGRTSKEAASFLKIKKEKPLPNRKAVSGEVISLPNYALLQA
jgi:hypothetical protein